jgi:YegS/Rv2252/BmrU family lipid kinase
MDYAAAIFLEWQARFKRRNRRHAAEYGLAVRPEIRHTQRTMAEASPPETDWVLIVNPAAGAGRAGREAELAQTLLARHGLSTRRLETGEARHSIRLIQDCLGAGSRRFLLAGGDGLLHEAVNAVFTQTEAPPASVTLGLIPLGSGNDWARTFEIPRETAGAVAVIRQGATRSHDVGRVYYQAAGQEGSAFFLNMCGIGFDAHVARRVAAAGGRDDLGEMKYHVHLLASLMEYAPSQMTIRVDDAEVTGPVLSGAIGIGRYNGGGLKQLPNAEPDDGLLDVTVIAPVGRLRILRSLPQLRDGTFVHMKEVSTLRGRLVTVHSDPPCWLEADGEVLGTSPFRFEILPRAIRVVAGSRPAGHFL